MTFVDRFRLVRWLVRMDEAQPKGQERRPLLNLKRALQVGCSIATQQSGAAIDGDAPRNGMITIL